jgi:hypothetical protein
MKLTEEQFRTIAQGHVQRVVDNMDIKTLMQIVYDNMLEYFTTECECRENVQSELLEDIFNHEGGDEDSVYEFLVGTGVVSDDEADRLVSEFTH